MQRFFCWTVLLLFLGLGPATTVAQQLGGRAHSSNMRFNKLRTGTLTNCGANTFVTGWSAAGTQVCVQIALSMLTDGASVVTLTGVQKLTNKQNILKAVAQTVITNAITPNIDTTDVAILDAITADLTINAPVGTGGNPVNEQELLFRFLSTTPRVLTWNAVFTAENGPPLPTVTTGDGVTYDRFKFIYNSTSAKWGLVANTKGVGRGVTTLASSTTFTCNADLASLCEMQMTGATGTITIAAPTGSPINGQELRLALQCTNAQTLTWNAAYLNGIYQTKPATCPANVTTWLEVRVRYSSVESGWVFLVGASTASTATFTVTKNLPVTGVKFPATNPGRLDRSGNTDKLLFDATTSQCVAWQFMWPTDATAGGAIKLNASAASATTGSINFDLSVWKLTPTASVDVDTESYDSVNTCNTATVPGTAGFPFTVTCTLTNKDGVVAGDNTLIKMCRNIGDTATGDAEVELVELSYTH